jgi:multiple sugar transport system substrate-binding protein
MLRTVATLVCLLLLPCLTGGCRQEREPQHLINFWGFGREGEVIQQLLPRFEALHPEIRVRVQQMPLTAAHEKLLTAYVGDSTPDICQLGNTWLPELAALGALEPLGGRAAASAAVTEADYFAGIWQTNRVAGTLYGVPWYVDTRLLFYRRDLLRQAGFDAPPQTWDEWARMLAAIKQQAGPSRYSVLLPLNEFEPLLVLAMQQPEDLLRDEGRHGNFRGAGFQRALSFYVDIFRNGWSPPVSNTQISNVWDEFGRGYYSFYVSGPWQIGEFKRRLPPRLQSTWMTAPMPGPQGPGASLAGGSSLVIFRRSRHKDDAWALLEYLSSPAVQREFYQLTGDLPPRRASWNDARLQADPYNHAFLEQLERVKPTPKVPEWERIVNEMQHVAEHAAHGDLTVEAAGQELDHTVDAILEKRRWLMQHGRAQ